MYIDIFTVVRKYQRALLYYYFVNCVISFQRAYLAAKDNAESIYQ